MKRQTNALFVLAFCLTAALCVGCKPGPQQMETPWPPVTKEMRPWTRWWWMGNAVDQNNLGHLMAEYHQAGFGGVEITPIYGASGYESQYIQYLSPQWMKMLAFTIGKADSLGMGVDMNNGTGWPFGGPQISPPYAASKLVVQTYRLKAGQRLREKISIKNPRQSGAALQCLTAYNAQGGSLDLFGHVGVDGTLNWTPESGEWELYAAFCGKTGQKVKRAAPGGAGFVMDHLSNQALNVYLSRFDSAFQHVPPGVRCFFNDSYEVYGADWTPGFFEAFQRLRGYDLRPFIKMLVSDSPSDTVVRIKSDYRQTMSDMLLANFTKPWGEWAHQYGGKTRNQAHGSPGNLLDLYAADDIPECETFGSADFPIPGLKKDTSALKLLPPDPVMLKFASSAAHVSGKNLVSSETFTWLGEHFTVALSQCKPQVEQAFLAGVNHVFYHGTAYSPEDAPWPGWLFYASVNFAPSNSFWPHINGLNNYITRCQSVLQLGHADNELLVYWPIFDVWHNAKGAYMSFQVHNIDDWLQPTPFYKAAKQLMGRGFSMDFVSDNLLGEMQFDKHKIYNDSLSNGYKLLVVPRCEVMPLATLKKIVDLASSGATVVMQNLPDDVPGYHDVSARRLEQKEVLKKLHFHQDSQGQTVAKIGEGTIIVANDLEKAIENQGIERERLTDSGLQFVRRVSQGDKYYYLVNHTAKAVDGMVPVNGLASSVLLMDPQDGRVGLAQIKRENASTLVKMQLKPGQAIVLRASPKSIDAEKWHYIQSMEPAIVLNAPWHLHFTKGGPILPKDQDLGHLLSWTDLPDSNAVRFSGSAIYTTHFEMPENPADGYLLQLGKVDESARVWVNGQEVGILWSVPFEARIGKLLQPGPNTIKIEVANLMANRIRDMDRRGIAWRKYHEINFVNLEYKPFDASGWPPMPSGLLGPVTIVPLGYEEAGAAMAK